MIPSTQYTLGIITINTHEYTKSVCCEKMFYVSCHSSIHNNVKKKYLNDIGKKQKYDLSTKAWYIKYEAYRTISKIYERVTKPSTHRLPK